MENFMISFLMISAVMSLIILIVWGLRAIMPEKFSPKLRYMVWVVILVGLLIPFRPTFGEGLVAIDVPIAQQSALPPPQGVPIQNAPMQNISPIGMQLSSIEIIAIVWLSVAFAMLLYHVLQYVRFSKMVRRWGVNVTDSDILEIFNNAKAENGLEKKKIRLKECDFISTSMLMGFARPVVLLPSKDFDEEELSMIFSHELIHYKRRDLLYKLLSVITVSLHWFNPTVYLMSAAMRADCEASCDESVLLSVGVEKRQYYAELVMEMIGDKKPATLLSTCFYKSKQGIKTRMRAIMKGYGRVKKLAFVFPLLLIMVIVFSGSVIAFSPQIAIPQETTEQITAVQARDIALNEAGGGIFDGLYYDSYLEIFRIEILQEDRRLYLAVDSSTGDVIIYRREAR